MNCRLFRRRMTELLDVNPDPTATADLIKHAAECVDCARELHECRLVLSALSPSQEARASSNLKERIMNRVAEMDSTERSIQRKRVFSVPARLSFAAAALLIVALVGGWLTPRNAGQSASALTVLAQAAEICGSAKTMHIQAEMRTVPGENFDTIFPDAGFVPIEMSIAFGSPGKWRVEKAGRAVVMDGESVTGLIRSDLGPFAFKGAVGPGYIGWLAQLLRIETLLEDEQSLARRQGAEVSVEQRSQAGVAKTVLTIRTEAQGDYSQSDYRKNKSVLESDNTRVYTFDAATHRLEAMHVAIRKDGADVPVFRTTSIRYDVPLPASLFTLDIPAGATWLQTQDGTADAGDNSSMSPAEVTETILAAMADRDWDTLRDLCVSFVENPGFRQLAGGLKVISVGKPFQSGLYPGWFVPYEVRLPSGELKKGNLAIRNDSPRKQWEFDGGF